MNRPLVCLVASVALFVFGDTSEVHSQETSAKKIRVMILTGQSNHGWKASSVRIRDMLNDTKLFEVEIMKTPPQGGDMTQFRPDFGNVNVVVLDYNGEPWSAETRQDFMIFVRGGGGVVLYHAATQLFPKWPQFNEMMGLGAWGGRDESAGPKVRYRDGKIVLDKSAGKAGLCLDPHEYVVDIRDASHPITRGLPTRWMHGKDEFYSNMRGPARNLTVLETVYSDPKREAHYGTATHGTGEHEPAAFTVQFGKGRVFSTVLGHVSGGAKEDSGPWPAIECVGFQTLIQRGTEWAATGKVTQSLPKDFPTASSVVLRSRSRRK